MARWRRTSAVLVESRIGGGATISSRFGCTTACERRKPHAASAGAPNSSPPEEWHRAAVFTRDSSSPATPSTGPAIIIEPHQTIVVEHGWQRHADRQEPSLLSASRRCGERTAIGTKADPVMLEIFNNLFMSIAEQMGVSLQNTA